MDKKNKILIVEDSNTQRAILVRWVKNNGYEAIEAEDCASAKKFLLQLEIDVVLLDWNLPDGSGVDLIKEILESSRNGWIPIIMVTANTEPEKIREAIDAGATDFIRKPPEEIELIARVYSSLRIKNLQDKLLENSIKDALTGLYNRRYINERSIQEFSRCKRHENPFSLVIFDLDHFKNVNDTYGHEVGDLVLRSIASIFQKSIRNSDILGRFGGEEFLILMPETKPENASKVLEKVKNLLLDSPILHKDKDLQITFSAGIAGGSLDSILGMDQLFQLADSRLYEAKKSGRNKIVYA